MVDLNLFKKTLKAEAISCYENFKHSYDNSPFIAKDKIIDDLITFEIKQNLGKKALKAVLDNKTTKEQLEVLDHTINHYKKRTIKAALEYTKHSDQT
ncbi:hypothetical protein [Formosa sp. A9]|uniref:hypothetical protein n=1 Tax=Formosa sp. A9 TaxID=3442641 RepID=UPI003EB847CD